jgi:hypothetical protein
VTAPPAGYHGGMNSGRFKFTIRRTILATALLAFSFADITTVRWCSPEFGPIIFVTAPIIFCAGIGALFGSIKAGAILGFAIFLIAFLATRF